MCTQEVLSENLGQRSYFTVKSLHVYDVEEREEIVWRLLGTLTKNFQKEVSCLSLENFETFTRLNKQKCLLL